ncbi:MAG: ATP-dependent DNA helicase RecG [Alphaproteobacteria bacterium]|nr:ATP-dependent DNA helicase RecG [Alphaproteobacteria bacterium]
MPPRALDAWFTAITSLRLIGPATAEAFTRLLRISRDVEAAQNRPPVLRDLLFHLPIGAIDRRVTTPVAAAKAGDYATFEVRIIEHVPPPRARRKVPYRIVTQDDSGILILTYFHVKDNYLARSMPVDARRIVAGTVEMYDGQATIAHPDIAAPVEKAAQVLRLAPVYPLTYGLTQRMLHYALEQAWARIKPLPEWLDAAFMRERQFCSFTESLHRLHAPDEMADIAPQGTARLRLAYDELLANQLALSLVRRMVQRQESWKIPHQPRLEAQWKAALPFTLTAGQTQVLSEIARDMAGGQRMVRLLQGDVGSGKTILAFGAMVQVVAAGFQACLMAPTDLLARQHRETLAPLAKHAGMRLGFLSGKMRKSEQAEIRAALAAGEYDIIIGTHALFQEDVAFQRLALLIIDEQHRFGVGQRMKLAGKGLTPHLLQMTATPIPRSLSMTLYGDMEISNLTERPPGRLAIDTRAVPSARMAEMVEGLARVLAAGEKAYWVCPLIEEQSEEDKIALNLDLAAAEERFGELSRRFGDKVGLVHGRMKLAEREKVMRAFAHGAVQLLVATTVVEVGVNVPEATVMVIEHAERFGLAQLHQLRGRVGRSDKPSRCILLYHEPLSALAKARLNILRDTNDGFVIAEEDLRLRGAGDMLGTQQTGMPDFVLADMAHHLPLLRIAHDDAKLILHRDPELLGERGQALRLLLALFEYDAAMTQLKSV